MRDSRPAFAWLLLFSAVLVVHASMTFGDQLRRTPWLVPAVLALLVLSPWLLGPFLIRFGQWESSRLRLAPVDPAGPRTPPIVRQAGPGLAHLGFVPLRTFELSGHVPNVSGYISVYFNEKSWDVAKYNVAIAPNQEVAYLVFGSELSDGTEVYTSNLAMPLVTPPIGGSVQTLAFPGIDDPARLYAIHRARLKNALRRRPLIDDPYSYVYHLETRALDHHVERGYYYRPAEGHRQFPTWKGAVLMAWKSAWPVPLIRRAWKLWRSWFALRKLAIDEQGDLRDDQLDR